VLVYIHLLEAMNFILDRVSHTDCSCSGGTQTVPAGPQGADRELREGGGGREKGQKAQPQLQNWGSSGQGAQGMSDAYVICITCTCCCYRAPTRDNHYSTCE
jgi:hypothetical protein